MAEKRAQTPPPTGFTIMSDGSVLRGKDSSTTRNPKSKNGCPNGGWWKPWVVSTTTVLLAVLSAQQPQKWPTSTSRRRSTRTRRRARRERSTRIETSRPRVEKIQCVTWSTHKVSYDFQSGSVSRWINKCWGSSNHDAAHVFNPIHTQSMNSGVVPHKHVIY